jgi:hypothetical protein
MTTRRTLLQGAASLIAPAQIRIANAIDLPSRASPFIGFIEEFRKIDAKLLRLCDAMNRAESNALTRNIKWSDCPVIARIYEREGDCYREETELIQRASRTPAVSIDEIVLKLILWRLTDAEANCFANSCDMLSFAAYRDLLTLTGRSSLTQKADDKALEIMWDDRAFDFD